MIKSLTSLRGIFILFIFFHHCLNIYPGGGSMAVAFFFVLGGFSMTLGYKDRVLKPEFSYKQYITRRCIKFYPLHWLCLLAVLPLVGLPFTVNQGGAFVLNVSLMQTLLPIKELFFSFNAVSWYLADTLIFSLVFPPVIKLILKSSTKGRACVATVIAAIYIAVAIMIPIEQYHYVLYISPYMRLADFVFGIYLALGYFKLKEQSHRLEFFKKEYISLCIIIALTSLLILESCLFHSPVIHVAPIYWPLVALVILTASLIPTGGGKFIENRVLLLLGELSFTIFLTHQLVLRYVSIIFNYCYLDKSYFYILLTLLLTFVVSFVVERYVLNPITQWLTKRIQPSMTARS